MAASNQARLRRGGWLAVATLVVMGAYYLLTHHTAHTLGVLPYLLILVCPLMHVFGYRHRRDDGHAHEASRDRTEP